MSLLYYKYNSLWPEFGKYRLSVFGGTWPCVNSSFSTQCFRWRCISGTQRTPAWTRLFILPNTCESTCKLVVDICTVCQMIMWCDVFCYIINTIHYDLNSASIVCPSLLELGHVRTVLSLRNALGGAAFQEPNEHQLELGFSFHLTLVSQRANS